MVSLDDLNELTLYKKQFYLPIDLKDKRHGSAIMLLTPSRRSSILAMTTPYIVNKRYVESYYIEKDITRYITNESVISNEDLGEYIFEAKLPTKERNELKDSVFGLPKQRKYPLNDKNHILLAIKFFNHCPNGDKDELAKNIIKAIGSNFSKEEAEKINVGKNNTFLSYWEKSKYYKKSEDKISESFIIEESVAEEYFNEYVNNHAVESLGKKTKIVGNIVLSGYSKDIAEVALYINKDAVSRCYSRINKPVPDKINLIVTRDPNIEEEFTDDSVIIYTPRALKSHLPHTDYRVYLDYILQLQAIYTMKPYNGIYRTHPGRVMDSIAEPAAIVLSNILDKDTITNNKDALAIERVFKYIIDTYGIDVFLRIVESNDVKSIFKYTKEFGLDKEYNKSYFESMQLIKEEAEQQEEAPSNDDSNNSSTAASISLDDPMPESLKKLQKMGTRLKRRIRQHSVYKLNKIIRDLQRGNLGTEERNYTTGLEDIKTGSVLSTPSSNVEKANAENESAISESKFYNSANNDYISEGNMIYLFEDSNKYDTVLRQAIYRDRIKNNKEVVLMYNKIKAELPFIKYTYVDISRYNNKNLFVDLSYYNESFFRNISTMNDEDKSNSVRIFSTYMELMERLIKNNSLSSYKKKTIFIPVLDWRHNNSMKMWMYREDINPISAIYHMIKTNPSSLKRVFGDNDVVFLGGKNYFKVNFSNANFTKQENANKFVNLIKRITTLGYNNEDPDPIGEYSDSPKGIAMSIIDKVETSKKVSIDNVSKVSTLNKSISLLPSKNKAAIQPVSHTTKAIKASDKTKLISDEDLAKASISTQSLLPSDKAINTTTEEEKKDAIVDAIVTASTNASSVDHAMNNLDNDDFKSMIDDLQNSSVDNTRVDATQASKVIETQNEFHKKQIEGRTVEEILKADNTQKELPKTKLNVASINDDWKELTFVNFDKNYDLNADIMKMLEMMQHWTYPVAVKDVTIRDNSTSEDLLDLWTIECVDFRNTKFTIRVDVPKFINNSNFLKLRGNEKNILIQSVLLPIIKTGLDECQIIGVGGYNKIFVERFGSRVGQSIPAASNIVRALNKYSKTHKTNSNIKVVYGDNNKICMKYALPMDYIDIAKITNSIETPDYRIYFNQDEFREEYALDDTKGIPIAVNKKDKSIIYFDGKTFNTVINQIANLLCNSDEDFQKIYNSIKVSGSRFSYSRARILNTRIPIVMICGYLEGLITTMNKAGVDYHFEKELDKSVKSSDEFDYIRFKDGYLVYKVTYSSSLLMNGMKDQDTESYSITDINNQMMYIDFFNAYGKFIPNGIENSYDCMIDPITKEILESFKLPTDYVSVLIYASNLLADNKYIRHIDQAGRRWRRKELIAGYFYKALSTSYQAYSQSLRNSRKGSKMEMKQSAIIDLIVSKDPSTTDLSVNNIINDVECANTVSNKGLVGMNVSRGYTINTRGYDDSMLNLLGMDTGFSGNVGINRQATVNANIEGGRGYVKTIDGDVSRLSAAAAFTITEALTPFGSTHDDPPRTLMTYVQTSKHLVRCDNNDPTLITTGADEAIPYLTSDIFAYKAKKDGKIVELVQEGTLGRNYIVIEYDDKSHEYINLSEEVKKNSDGGYYVPMKLDTDMRLGSKFKAGEIIAYDKLSFSKSLGESGNLAANIGTLAKVAIINTDEAFEDSGAVTETFAEMLGTDVIQGIDTRIEKGCNIFVYKNIGDSVVEGDTLFSYQADFGDEVLNTLLKNLTMDSEQLSELGRTPVKSKYTGVIEDIVIYRTCELEGMSDSLRDFVLKYEDRIRDIRSTYEKYSIDTASLPKAGKVPEIGVAKNLNDAVLIIYYIKYKDKVGIGDKATAYSANKMVIKYIISKDSEPYTAFRPDEHIDTFMSLSSISGRMTCSITLFAAVSKLMVELDRSVKDLAGIPYSHTRA